ncbi:MAG: carboxypeptidase regulatory-like domain-containing protein [Anaerolineae bacterium]|nr:carboxypeptidase regulatory-like domain-containing protein [Anaerolineae bacterium]
MLPGRRLFLVSSFSVLVLTLLLASPALATLTHLDASAALQTTGTAGGMVYESDGITPISGASIWIYTYPDFVDVPGSPAITNGLGEWSIDLPAGTYGAMGAYPDRVNEFYDESGLFWSGADPFVVTVGATTTGINFTLDPSGWIRGTVYAADGLTPLENVNVRADEIGMNVCTGPGGEFNIWNVPMDTPVKVYAGGGGWCANGLAFQQEWYNNAPNAASATPVSVSAGQMERTGVDFTLDANGTISGIVTDQTTGAPLGGIHIGYSVNGQHGPGVCTQPDGSYTLPYLPFGVPIIVNAENNSVCPPQVSYLREYWQETPVIASAAPITLTVGAPTQSGIDFTLEPGGVISGTVTDAITGLPIQNIHVWAEIPGQDVGGKCTDAAGQYHLYGIPFNTPARVSASPFAGCQSPAGYLEEFWQETPNYGQATLLTIAPAQYEITGINFTLDLGASISGHVYESDGVTPITSGAWVDIMTINNGPMFWGNVNPDGSYMVEGLPAATYRARGWGGDYVLELYDEAGILWDSATLITLSAGQTMTGVDFTLDHGGIVSGTVYEADGVTPIADMNVNVYGTNISQCTDSNGQYLLHMPLNVPYKIQSGGFNHCGGGAQNLLREFWQETPDENAATPITLTDAAPDITGITFTLEVAPTISGTVYQTDGTTPLSGVQVRANDYASNQPINGTQTDPNGHYTLSVPPGTYKVAASGIGWADEYYLETGYQNATPVVVSVGASVTGIDFTLDPGGSISGVVYEEDGVTPVPYANVGLNLPFGHCADANGVFTLHSIPLNVPFKIFAYADGQSWCGGGDNGHFSREWYDNVPDEAQATVITLTLAEPNRQGIIFTLAPAGTISGTVYAADGITPLANIGVDTEQGGMGRCTDANGHYTLVVSRDVPYKIRAGGNNFCQGGPQSYLQEWWQEAGDVGAATPVTATAAAPDVTGITFTLEVGGTVSGVVTDQTTGAPLVNANVSADFDGYGFGVCTDASGHYEIGGLPYGIGFRVRAGGGSWCGGGLYAQEFWQEKQYWHLADLIMLTSGVPGPTNINFTLEPGGSISGVVRDEGGAPQGGVPVDTQPGGYGTCSNPDGSYTLSGMPLNAPYKIRAGGVQWGGCPNQQFVEEYYQDVYFEEYATPISPTTASPNIGGIDITLGLGGTISGHIADGDTTQPAAKVLVGAQALMPNGEWTNSGVFVCSDAGGDYVLRLPEGSYRVGAGGSCAGGSVYFAWQYYPGFPTPEEATVLVLSDLVPDISGIDFTSYAAGTVHGTVRDAATGDPIPDISVQFFYPFTGLGICTDANGEYTAIIDYLNVPFTIVSPSPVQSGGPGQWNGCGNTTVYAFEYWQEALQSDQATMITFTPAFRDLTADFTLAPGGTVSGVVTGPGGAPLPNILVNVDTGGSGHGVCTDANGDWSLSGVPLDVAFRVSAGGANNWCGGGTFAQEFWQEKRTYAEADLVTLTTAAPTKTDVNFTLEPGGSISGQLYQSDGVTPLTGWSGWLAVEVYTLGNYQQIASVEPAPDGSYSITGLAAGQVRVDVVGDHYGRMYYDDAFYLSDLTPVVVTAGAVTPNIDFTVGGAGTISGRVTDTAGNPLANLNVGFLDAWLGACTDAQGYYTVPFVPLSTAAHPLAFKFYAGSSNNWCGGATNYTQEWWLERTSEMDATAVTLTAATPDLTGANFTLSTGGTISGVVTDALGVPLANVSVETDGGYGQCTGADGTYILSVPFDTPLIVRAGAGESGICPGETQIYAPEWWQEAPDTAAATPVISTAAAPHLTGIHFTLEVGGSVEGTITEPPAPAPAGAAGPLAPGDPIPNVSVSAEFGGYSISTCTDASGQYTLPGLPFNQPFVVRAGGDLDCGGESYVEAFYADAAPILLTPEAPVETGVDVVLTTAGTISGVVRDNQTAALLPFIAVTLDSGIEVQTACTDGFGAYLFPGLPLETAYTLAAGGPTPCTGGSPFYVKEWWQEAAGGGSATPVTVSAAVPDVAGVDFTLDGIAQGSLSATLQGHGNAPDPRWVTTLHVVIKQQSDGAVLFDALVTTDPSGGFTVQGLPTGAVTIWVKGSHTLANVVSTVLMAGDNVVILGTLLEGDANDNNVVNITDFSILAQAFGQSVGDAGYDARADFTNDSRVTILDFSLLALNFGLSGAAP